MKSVLTNPALAQKKQDEFFQRMSADKKIAFGAQLWLMAKELAGEKFTYATKNRPSSRARRGGANPKKT